MKKRLTKKSCEVRNTSKIFLSRDEGSVTTFLSREKPHLDQGLWLLDVYSEDKMRVLTSMTRHALGLNFELQECELAEIDIEVTYKIYDADGNLKRN